MPNLSNLPPGVSANMIPGNRLEDDFADRVANGWRPKCMKCGGFLSLEPEAFEEEMSMCDGKPKKYTEKYSEALIAILGEEYRDKTYDIYFAKCGEETGPEGHNRHEIYEGCKLFRTCHNCGFRNVEQSY